MEFCIRTFVSSDELGVKKCIFELKKYESQFDAGYFTDGNSVDKLFEDIQEGKNNGGEIFVAEIDGQIVGFISLSIENKNDVLIVKKEDVIYISDTSVLPEYRNRGIGRGLLAKAYEFAKGKNVRFVKLIVFAGNTTAKLLYEKDGFKDYEVTMLKEIK
jgi:ribosomal protein S18 acetylase RimI-like enzyme